MLLPVVVCLLLTGVFPADAQVRSSDLRVGMKPAASADLAGRADQRSAMERLEDLSATPAPEVYTLEECVAIALRMRPTLREARSRVESQAARVGQAASSARPQVQVSPSYGYSYSSNSGEGGRINTDFTLSQLIFDWNRTNLSITGARQELEARRYDEQDTIQDIVRDVMDAYFALNRSNRTLAIAQERVENYERRLQWAQDFYDIGTKARIEVTRAQTDLANARLDLVTAQGTRQKALSNLAYVMGVPISTPDNIVDRLEFEPYYVPLDDAVVTAMGYRSDYTAQRIRVEAAETNVELARKGLTPSLTGNASYSFSGESNPADDRDWRLALGLNIPVFDGGLTREQIRQAEADLEGTIATSDTLRQSIVLEVRTAYASLLEAEESVSAALEVLRQARETLDLAEGRYRAGVGESLEISDAVESYAMAQMSVVNALYNHKAAEIELKRVMGVVYP